MKTEKMNYEEAVSIYIHRQAVRGFDFEIIPQPSKELSTLVGGTWYLRNINGPLGRVGCNAPKVGIYDISDKETGAMFNLRNCLNIAMCGLEEVAINLGMANEVLSDNPGIWELLNGSTEEDRDNLEDVSELVNEIFYADQYDVERLLVLINDSLDERAKAKPAQEALAPHEELAAA